MAIVQISRITQRKGLETDLPQPLAGAELGWAIDQRRLFIGNGELAEGAPVVGNTEILTEYSDILAFSTAYTYKGEAAGYAVQTGPTAGTPVSQSLQARLDSYAIVTDFGAKGDGITDDTAAIQRALTQLYCQQVNTQIRRSLFFPAGTYIVTDTILIPPYCTMYGEGSQGSIISLQIQTWTSATAWQSSVLVEYLGAYYRSKLAVPAGIAISDTNYWEVSSLPTYIARTADSLCQIGVNIGTNGATPPNAIAVTNMKFNTDQLIDGLLIEKCSNSEFTNITVEGPLTAADLDTDADDIAAVRWSSSASLVCSHVSINDACLEGFTYGTATAQQIKSCVFNQCRFDTLYIGALLGGLVVSNGGPSGTKILGSVFDNIYAQGIQIQNASLNASGYNVFYDVGNHFNGTTLPATSVIDINANENVSIGDMFQRTTAYSGTYPRINLNNTTCIGYDSADRIQQGTYSRASGIRATLIDNSSTTTLFTVDALYQRAFKVDYTITRDTGVRTGSIMVAASTDGTGSNLAYDDSFVQNSDTGVTLSVTESGSVVSVQYATTSTGTDALISYSITKLA